MANLKGSSEVQTVNAQRYKAANALVGIARCNGLPIAFRRISALSRPGSFAQTRYQSITAGKITGLSGAKMRALARRLYPLN